MESISSGQTAEFFKSSMTVGKDPPLLIHIRSKVFCDPVFDDQRVVIKIPCSICTWDTNPNVKCVVTLALVLTDTNTIVIIGDIFTEYCFSLTLPFLQG